VSLFYRLGALPFVGADEPRYARVAEEMQSAWRWVTPTLQCRPWLEKTPHYYRLTIPFMAALGASELSSRLAPALAGLATALVVFWAGRRWYGARVGLYAGGIVLTSLGFVAFGRSASTDMPLTACLTGALALLGAAATSPLPRPALLGAYGLLGLAVLAKGPVALLLAGGIAALFWWLDERGGALARWQVPLGGLIACAVALPWYVAAFRQNGFAFVSVFFVNHNLARFVSDIHHHSEPFYYYAPVLAGLLLPWTGWLALLVPRPPWIRPAWTGDPAALWLACWTVFPLLFFSLSRSKLPGYVLPIIPPIALLLARRFDALEAGGAAPRRAAWCFLLIAAAAAVAAPILFQERYGGAWRSGLGIGVALGAPALGAFVAARRGKLGAAWMFTVLSGVLASSAIVALGSPALGAYHSGRDLARAAVAAGESGEPLATYRWFHHTFHYYTGYRVADDLADRDELIDFALAHPRFLLVTRLDRLDEACGETGFTARVLARQGDLVLVRMSHPR
jgi:4-amino-4-deoxy-L-arabinose transferase-like glycosyltransferase